MSFLKKNNADSNEKKPGLLKSILILVVLGGVGYYLFGGGLEEGVASDFVDQYKMAEQAGDKMGMCVQAGMVSAGYQQAKNMEKYKEWKGVERRDCAAVGIQKP